MSVASVFDNGGAGRFASSRRASNDDDLPFVEVELRNGVPPSHIARRLNRPLSAVASMIETIERAKPKRPAPKFPDPPPAPPGAKVVLSLFRGLMTIRPTVEAVLDEVAAKHHVAVGEICGGARTREVAWARQEVMWTLRQHGIASALVGKILGGRDHSTVLFGAAQHAKRMSEVKGL